MQPAWQASTGPVARAPSHIHQLRKKLLLHFEPILNSPLLVGGIALTLAALLWIQPRYQLLSMGRRASLLGLRFSLIVMLTIAMLRPTCVSSSTVQQSAVLLIGLDQTRSMTLPAASGETETRWQAQTDALASAAGQLRTLSEKFDIKVYGYDLTLHELDFAEGRIVLPEQPTGDQTDLGSPLYDAISNERGKRLAGIVWLGDGAQTAFDPRIEIQATQRELAHQKAPLLAVPFGPADADAETKDVAVVNFPDQRDVFVKNQLLLEGVVRARGLVNVEIPVELVVEDAAGQQTVIGPLPVMAREPDEFLSVEIPYTPEKPGQYKLTLRAAEQRGELVVNNNELSAYLNVLEGGIKVLYVEGDLRWEQKFLKRSLDASRDIDVDFLWLDPRDRDRWPVDLTRKIQEGAYDLFILGDLDSTALYRQGNAEGTLRLMAEQVAAGKALLMLGGYHSFGPGGYRDTPLADLLPVEIGRYERQDFDAPISRDLHLSGPLPMEPATGHYLTQLASPEQNQAVWRTLPPLTGANKFANVKPSARLLLESASHEPLLVEQVYGSGRVLAFAGDSTWRWWMQGHATEHRRFWRQMVLWLAKRDGDEKNALWLRLPQRRFNPRATVEFTTGVRTESGNPQPNAVIQAQVTLPGGEKQPINLAFGVEERTGAWKLPETPGAYLLEVTAQVGGETLTTEAKFMVFDHDVELSDSQPDHELLRRLALATEEFGGQFTPPEQLSAALQKISERPLETEITVEQKQWQLARTWWDAWLYFLVVAGLLTSEWGLRKYWGLV
ncbi:glutamine amidotransferase [Lignipirellula cremea]|uniref:Putative glutamine amidotransferase domain-containing protein n=1 Tax=Lignipirellula cremea TaxID=2528010 RepID=A0A518DYZ9_9BACT|nr:glutamine amidotransferase [Lignipirellula cremea]QDU97077.1 hypothetical protein Pla8534_49030 [Lignipirellula cremea]